MPPVGFSLEMAHSFFILRPFSFGFPVGYLWEVSFMEVKDRPADHAEITERRIGPITYVVTVGQSPTAREPLKTKLQKMVLEAARLEHRKLSEECGQ